MPGSSRRSLKSACVVCVLLYVALSLIGCGEENGRTAATPSPEPQFNTEPAAQRFNFPDKDYTKFDHESEQHKRLPCLVCHTTEDRSGKIGFPGHIPCASCHTEHFQQKDHGICSVCHTDGNTGQMKQFPTLASFSAKFDHALHAPQAQCATCHRPTAQGVGFSVPSRANSHSTCFQCHSTGAEVAKTMESKGTPIDSCATCHAPGRPPANEAPANYIGGFSHAKHLNARGLSCGSCHTIRSGGGSAQVSEPMMAMHKVPARAQSCATCHNGKRAFGGEDFANCKRCHQGSTFSF